MQKGNDSQIISVPIKFNLIFKTNCILINFLKYTRMVENNDHEDNIAIAYIATVSIPSNK
uniref:Uncharacterized protein n=1 Tax=Onchocerca volvulus TaxID=6282 RepID=A0A8R1XS45_ONCVO